MSLPPDEPPVRLSDAETETGRLLAASRTATGTAEPGRKARVWRQLSQQPKRSPARWLVPATLALAATVLVLLTRAPALPAGTIALTAGEVQTSSTDGAWTTAQVPQQLGRGGSLRTGEHGRSWTRFPGAGALLLESGRLRLTSQALELEQGSVVIASATPGHVTVSAGAYRVEATDAVFTVRVAAERAVTEVVIDEGAVTVRGPSTELRLEAGTSWASQGAAQPSSPGALALARTLLAAKADEAPLTIEGEEEAELSLDGVAVGFAPVKLLTRPGAHAVSRQSVRAQVEVKAGVPGHLALPPEAASYEQARRLSLESRFVEAVALYEALSSGQGARAEAALYEVGRIRQRFLGDPKGALEAFSAHARRFPGGVLAPEAALSAIEVQLQLEQLEPALAAMDAFLVRFPASERLDDVRFLQARVHAQRGDCAVALPLFGGLLDHPTHGDDALYLTAYCEQALKKQGAARAHLQQYLARFPAGKHRVEAKAALKTR